MTWAELIQYVTDKLARPNDTYITQVLPNVIKQCIDNIEIYWDWSSQYYELTYTVVAGSKEIVVSVADAQFKKISGNFIYDLVNERIVQYKKFFPQIVVDTGIPYWFTISPDSKIYLSALGESDTVYTVPMRLRYTNYTTHWLLTKYPYYLADYVVAFVKKDFDPKEGFNLIKIETANIQKINIEEKDKTPMICNFNFGIRRSTYFELGADLV